MDFLFETFTDLHYWIFPYPVQESEIILLLKMVLSWYVIFLAVHFHNIVSKCIFSKYHKTSLFHVYCFIWTHQHSMNYLETLFYLDHSVNLISIHLHIDNFFNDKFAILDLIFVLKPTLLDNNHHFYTSFNRYHVDVHLITNLYICQWDEMVLMKVD